MTKLNPWKFGAVLSITVVVSYILCALFWYFLPGLSMELLNTLFHGMDFRKIYSVTPFALGSFLLVLAVLAVWACVLGAIYAAVRNLLFTGDKS
jgi:hypothetical protein